MTFTDNCEYMGLSPSFIDVGEDKASYARYHHKELVEFFKQLTFYLDIYQDLVEEAIGSINPRILQMKRANLDEEDLQLSLALTKNDFIQEISLKSYAIPTISVKKKQLNLFKFLKNSEFQDNIHLIYLITKRIYELSEYQNEMNPKIHNICLDFNNLIIDKYNIAIFIMKCENILLELKHCIVLLDKIKVTMDFARMQILYLLEVDKNNNK